MATSDLAPFLIKDGILTEAECLMIARDSGSAGGSFAKLLIALGIFSEEKLAEYISSRAKLPMARVQKGQIYNSTPEVMGIIEIPLLSSLEVVPVSLQDKKLEVLMIDPLDRSVIQQLNFFTPFKVRPVVGMMSSIHLSLKRFIGDFKPIETPLEKLIIKKVITPLKQRQKAAFAALALNKQPLQAPAHLLTPSSGASTAPSTLEDFSDSSSQELGGTPQVAVVEPNAEFDLMGDEASSSDNFAIPEESEVSAESGVSEALDSGVGGVGIDGVELLAGDDSQEDESGIEGVGIDGADLLAGDDFQESGRAIEDVGMEGADLLAGDDFQGGVSEENELNSTMLEVEAPTENDSDELLGMNSFEEELSKEQDDSIVGVSHQIAPDAAEKIVGKINHSLIRLGMASSESKIADLLKDSMSDAGIPAGILYAKNASDEDMGHIQSWQEAGEEPLIHDLGKEDMELILSQAEKNAWKPLNNLPGAIADLKTADRSPQVYLGEATETRDALAITSWESTHIGFAGIEDAAAEVLKHVARRLKGRPPQEVEGHEDPFENL